MKLDIFSKKSLMTSLKLITIDILSWLVLMVLGIVLFLKDKVILSVIFMVLSLLVWLFFRGWLGNKLWKFK